MKVVVSLWCKDGPDLDLMGGVRTFVQRSRGGIIPAFDLEELHGTMLIQSPDVVQGQPSPTTGAFGLAFSWLPTNCIQDCIYKKVAISIFMPSSYYSLHQII